MLNGRVLNRRVRAAAPLLLLGSLVGALACGPELSPTTSEGAGSTESEGSEGGSTDVDTTSAGAGTSSGTSAGLTDGLTGGPTEASTETAGTTDDCPFVCDPDLPEEPGLCDIFTQDCPEGQKCESVDMDGDGAWDTNTCVPIMGDAVAGEPCTAEGASGIDTCAKGYVCWHVDENGDGLCVPHCTGSYENPMCEECTSCVIGQDGILVMCLSGCDPLADDCVGSQVCVGDPNSDGFVCVLDASGGMAPAGTPCEFANVCNPGTMCADAEAVPHPACEGALGCCTPFCDYEQPGGACDGLAEEVPGIECVPYHEDPDPDSCTGAVGVCVVP